MDFFSAKATSLGYFWAVFSNSGGILLHGSATQERLGRLKEVHERFLKLFIGPLSLLIDS
jgi:hypothetical protein